MNGGEIDNNLAISSNSPGRCRDLLCAERVLASVWPGNLHSACPSLWYDRSRSKSSPRSGTVVTLMIYAILLRKVACRKHSALLMAATVALAPADAKVSPPAVGAVVPDFSLKDIHRRPRSLDGFKDKKAFVVVFIDTECPLANLYVPTADRTAQEVRRQGRAVPGDQFQQPGFVRQRLGPRPGAERAVPGAQGLRPEGCGCLRRRADARGVPARCRAGHSLPRPHRRPVRRRLPPRQADAERSQGGPRRIAGGQADHHARDRGRGLPDRTLAESRTTGKSRDLRQARRAASSRSDARNATGRARSGRSRC